MTWEPEDIEADGPPWLETPLEKRAMARRNAEKFHLFDHRNLRITGRNQTRCGRLDKPSEDPLKGKSGLHLENFKGKVHDEPREGIDYCQICFRDYQENGDERE